MSAFSTYTRVMAPPAYLLVFSDPGTGVAEDEFHDWYDNEHIPLRVAVPAFLNWTRWKARDGAKPLWGASYDLTSYEDTQKPPYTVLAQTRSDREKRIFKDIGYLERRTYELIETTYPEPSSLYNPEKSAPFTSFVSVDVKPGQEEEYNKWYDQEHIPLLSTIPGWIRSRRFVLRDWSKHGVEGAEDKTAPPKYLAVHEWAYLDIALSKESKEKLETPWKRKVDEEVVASKSLRFCEFVRSWERKA